MFGEMTNRMEVIHLAKEVLPAVLLLIGIPRILKL